MMAESTNGQESIASKEVLCKGVSNGFFTECMNR